MGVLRQIKTIADFEGVTITALEGMIGASKGVLSRAFRDDTDIQSKWISKIVENYPHYNCRWILTGKGEMITGQTNESEVKDPGQPYKIKSDCAVCLEKEKVISNMTERIQELKETISILREK